MTEDRRRRRTYCLSSACPPKPWRRRVFLLLSSILLFPSLAAAQTTLEEAIDLALRQNRDLATLQLSLQSAYYGVDAAEAPFGITFRPDGRVEGTDERSLTELGLTGSKKFSPGTVVEAGARAGETSPDIGEDQKRAAVHLQIRQPLFRNAGALVNREPVVQAKNDVLSARRRIELSRADLIVRVVESHENVIRLQQQLSVDQRSYKRFDQLYRLSQMRERQGRTTRVDTLRAEFERGQAELNIATTTEQLMSQRAEMVDLLALPAGTSYVALPGAELKIDAVDPDEAEAVALANRLDYAEVIQDFQDAARGVELARRELLPDLNLLARYEQLGEGASYDEASKLNQDAWFVGVSGDTDYPPRSQRATLGRAKISEETAARQIDILASSLRLQVQQALLSYDRAKKQVVYAERNHTLATDRARLTRRLFNLGRETSFNVTDAETGLLEAETRVLIAHADVSISAYRLLRVLGTLVESPVDLRPGPVNVTLNTKAPAP